MKTFLRSWALASAGFLLVDLATRPRRPVDRVTVWPGGVITPLRAELRTTPEVLVPPRSLCLCAHCRACRAGEFAKGA